MIEHRPSTYIKWLFSQDDPERLFSCGTDSRRITFIGDVAIEVYRNGEGISGIDEHGEIYVPGGGEDRPGTGASGVFLMRNGSQTVLSLPADTEYDVTIISPEGGAISMFDLLVSPKRLESEPGKMYIGRTHSGRFEFKVKAGESPEKPAETGVGEGHAHFSETAFRYSPAVVMSEELYATRDSFLSLSGLYVLLARIFAGLGILLLISIAIDIAHRYKVKRGHPPYSDWFIIAPHLICIAVFAGLTQYASFYMFTVGAVRAQLAAVTMFFIFLLALRGAIKSREPLHFLIAGFLLIAVNLTGMYYNKLPIDSFSAVNMIMFFAVVALLCALAIRMFKQDREMSEKNE